MNIKKISVCLIISSIALVGCGDNKDTQGTKTTTTRKAVSSNKKSVDKTKSDTKKSDTKKSSSRNEITETVVGKKIYDPTMKFDITINRYLENIPFDSTLDPGFGDGKVNVFVEINGINNSDYITLIATPDFKLQTEDGEILGVTGDGRVLEYIKDQGITTLWSELIKRGDTATRWLVFEVPDDQIDGKLVLKYNRSESKTYSDKVIPGYAVDVALN